MRMRGMDIRRLRLMLGLFALALAGLVVLAAVVLGDGASASARPGNVRAPAIVGIPAPGQVLRASPGAWAHRPTAFKYAWKRCSRAGAHCEAIRHASSVTYRLGPRDVGTTLRVSVVASNRSGHSRPATSAHTAVIVAAATAAARHLEYVLDDGLISVYDMGHKQRLVRTLPLPQTSAGIRGAAAVPATHMLFISYGGDGGGNGNGSVLAYDLLAERVVWTVHLSTGIDSGAVSPDGGKLYMPTGENSHSATWNVLDTRTGAVTGTIHGGEGPHNTVASSNGRYVYLGGRNHDYLGVYETATGHVREIGPLKSGVRPFTVNGSNTIAFTTATGFDGFQVSSLTSAKVLFTVSFGAVPGGFPFTAPSHGISLSPDEKQLYVIDAVHKQVQVYDVSGVTRGVAPTRLASIAVAGWSGKERPCAYDCGQDGWLQHSLDGRFVYVGDSGEVIETATRRVLTRLSTLANTRKFLEIDWRGGVPVATSSRSGVGYVG
jgi:DNA-binding beta-propeller fold protein YncE